MRNREGAATGNRARLLAGAKQCLLEKGYGHVTVRDISAAAGVSMAAIGYHFGSKEALLNAALFDALDEGETAFGRAIGSGPGPDVSPEAFEALWARLIESFKTQRTFWLATLEATLQAQRDPELRTQFAGGQQQGRSGMARILTGRPEDEIETEVIRSLGSVQLALISGVMLQWLTDPEAAPTASEVVAGLRALAKRAGQGEATDGLSSA